MPPESPEETYWTKPRQELRAWFQRNAPSLGELYEGALKMVFGPKFPGRTRFVAHAVREVRNRLPDVIAGTKSGGPVQYTNRLDHIVSEWRKAGFALDGTIPASITAPQEMPAAGISIPPRLYLKIAALTKDHADGREKPIETAFRLFGAIAPENQDLRDTLRPVVRQWIDVTEWFVKRVHDSGVRDSDVDITEFLKGFELFEATLGALVRGFFKTVEGLDEILEDANS